MVDFRNALTPSSVDEVAPFPAGLNDCVSGLHWLVANASDLGIDAARIVIAGESGGGNLTLATGLELARVHLALADLAGARTLLREVEKRTGIPGGFLESDLVDPRYFSPANLKNRLESYFQMLDARRSGSGAATA